MFKPWAFVGLSLCAGLVTLGAWSAVRGQAGKEGGAASASTVPLVIKEPAPREMNANERLIREALQAATEFEFVETPLADVAKFVAEKHGIPVLLDQKALDDAGVGSDTPITMTLRGVSLSSALKLLLRPLDMMYVPENEVLVLTTMDDAGQRLSTRVYDVSDLMLQKALDFGLDLADFDGSGAMWDYDSLIDLVTSTVAPTSWDAVGGPGSIAPYNGTLVFSQTDEVHEEVAALFSELRRVRKASGPLPQFNQKAPSVDEQGRHVVAYSIPLRRSMLSGNTYGGGGMGGGGAARNGMPNSFGGGMGGGLFAVVDPTKPETVAQMGGGGLGKKVEGEPTQPVPRKLVEPFPAVQELAAAAMATVEPNSWQPSGGVGTIRAIPSYTYSGNAGTLVVLQTPAVHAKLKKFLAAVGKEAY